jgi:hypothetical protein
MEERPCEDTARGLFTGLREDLEEAKDAGTLILDFYPPKLGESKLILFKAPRLWCLL